MTKPLPPELKKHRRSIQKACVFCHAKHIQCDVSRPCKNCVKRNITSSCRDNIRKKRKPNMSHENKSPSTECELQNDPSIVDDAISTIKQETYPDTDLSGKETTFSPDPNFDSYWANGDMTTNIKDFTAISNNDIQETKDVKDMNAINAEQFLSKNTIMDYTGMNPISNSNSYSDSDRNASIPSDNTIFSHPLMSLDMLSDSSLNDFQTIDDKNFLKDEDQFDTLCEPTIDNNINNYTINETNISPLQFRKGFPSVKDLYENQDLIKPHNYRLAYAQLKNMLEDKFSIEADQRLLPNLIKSILDNYAPKFMSLSSSMIPEDLVFQEVTLQRLLFEMESTATLVNCSPMAVWRRTGELCFTSNEFLSLTGFTKEEVYSSNRFIFEFWDNESIIEYFKKFEEVLAFGDSKTESPETHSNRTNFGNCTLILKNNVKLNCASCWTVVRDNFNIPLLIMGQFLPIFSKK